MKRLAIIATLGLALSGVATPAMAAEPIPQDQDYSLTVAPVDPSPSHHTIKAPKTEHGDLYLLFHGGFKDGTDSSPDGATDAAVTPRSSAVLLTAGVVVAKVAKAKALKQPKQAKSSTTKTAAAKQKTQKQPPPRKVIGAKQPKTTKVSKLAPPNMTPQQAMQYAFQNPPRIRPKKIG